MAVVSFIIPRHSLPSHISAPPLVDRYADLKEPIDDWHYEFLTAQAQPTSVWRTSLDASGKFKAGEKANYYKAMHQWYADGGGVRYRTQMKWADPLCANGTDVGAGKAWDSCNYGAGLVGSRLGLTLKLEYTNLGQTRYDTMTAMRRCPSKLNFPDNCPSC